MHIQQKYVCTTKNKTHQADSRIDTKPNKSQIKSVGKKIFLQRKHEAQTVLLSLTIHLSSK